MGLGMSHPTPLAIRHAICRAFAEDADRAIAAGERPMPVRALRLALNAVSEAVKEEETTDAR